MTEGETVGETENSDETGRRQRAFVCFCNFPTAFISLSPPPQNVLLNKLNRVLDYKWLDGCHVGLFLDLCMGRTNRQQHQIVTSDNPVRVF